MVVKMKPKHGPHDVVMIHNRLHNLAAYAHHFDTEVVEYH